MAIRRTRDRGLLSYRGPCGPAEEPLSHFRVALLTVATALAVIFLALLLTIQPVQHIVKYDLWGSTGLGMLMDPHEASNWQIVTVRGEGQVALNGISCSGSDDLQMAIDVLMTRNPVPGVRLQVAPDVRHERFIHVLAVLKGAMVSSLRLDTEPLPSNDPSLVIPTGVSPQSKLQEKRSSPAVQASNTGCAAQFGDFPMML